MKLLTGSNRRWLPRMRPYLASLANYSPFDNVLLGVDCAVPPLFVEELLGVRVIELPAAVLDGSPDLSQSVQHGSWLPYVDGPDDEVVIFTDGDIEMQRRPLEAEIEWLATLPANTVTCGWNSGPDETLAIEGARLFPKLGAAGIAANFGPVDTLPCYNIGVIAMRRATWRTVYARYMANWPLVCETFAHGARQQWLMSWVFSALGLRVENMPYIVHTHGCYKLPDGARFNGGVLEYHGVPVLFRHHV